MLHIDTCTNFYDGNPYLVWDYKGFDVDIFDEFPELNSFNVRTYAIFQKNMSIEVLAKPLNTFLDILAIHQQKAIADAMSLMSAFIKDDEHTNPDEASEYCRSIVDSLDEQIHLCTLFERFVNTHITLPDMSDAGTHPQDREELTFQEPEAKKLTELVMLCKLLTPIFGSYIYKYSVYTGNRHKEGYASSICTGLIEKHYKEVYEKINHYVRNLVYNTFKEDANSTYKGYTSEIVAREITNVLVSKKYTTMDLYTGAGHVIQYTASYIKSHIESVMKLNHSGQQVKVFDDPKEGSQSSTVEETNSSRIETESKPSVKPADVVSISKFAAKWCAKTIVKNFGYDPDFVDSIVKWYLDNHRPLSDYSFYAVVSYYGPYMCGGYSGYLLDYKTMIKLIVPLQLDGIKNNKIHFVYGLTMSSAMEEKIPTNEEFKMSLSWKNSSEFLECRKNIIPHMGLVSWDQMPKNIVSNMIQRKYLYHLAPQLWDMLEVKHRNGTIIEDHLSAMKELFSIINYLWKRRTFNDVSENTPSTSVLSDYQFD